MPPKELPDDAPEIVRLMLGLRAAKGWNQLQAARSFGYQREDWSEWERQSKEPPIVFCIALRAVLREIAEEEAA